MCFGTWYALGMPRPPRADEAGGLYCALNRGNSRARFSAKTPKPSRQNFQSARRWNRPGSLLRKSTSTPKPTGATSTTSWSARKGDGSLFRTRLVTVDSRKLQATGTRSPATPSRIIVAADAVIRGARYWVRNSGTSALRTACSAVSPRRCLKMRARDEEPITIRSACHCPACSSSPSRGEPSTNSVSGSRP